MNEREDESQDEEYGEEMEDQQSEDKIEEPFAVPGRIIESSVSMDPDETRGRNELR